MKKFGLPDTILLFLGTEPMTGYDMTKELNSSLVWRASHQQVYRELDKLVKAGLVVFERIPQPGKPDRKVHKLTELGQEQVAELREREFEAGDLEMVKLMGSSTIMLKAGNAQYFEALAEQLEQQIELEEAELARVDDPIEKLLVERSIVAAKAEMEYAMSAITTINKINEAANPDDEPQAAAA